MAKGTLVVNAKKQLRIKFTNSKGKSVEMPVPDAELAGPLRRIRDDARQIQQLNGREVELDEAKGQPKRIRPLEEGWGPAAMPAPPPPPPGGRRLPPAFHNPYNFVPALPREHVTGDLGDGAPAGHHRYLPDRISGVIRVELTTETPLLVPDAARAIDCGNDHKSYPVRVDADRKPYLPPTTVKGMLRAAYEALTNSRLAVFPGKEATASGPASGHGVRLAHRMATTDGSSLVPARVEGGSIQLLTGTTAGFPVWNAAAGRWNVPGDLLYAAWLRRYQGGPIPGSNDFSPSHGEEVHCWIEKFQHKHWDKKLNDHVRDFLFWRVRAIAPSAAALGAAPPPTHDLGKRPGSSYYQPLGQNMLNVRGWACITNRNINRKHDERVFFALRPSAPQPITPKLRSAWAELIGNYQSIHAADLQARSQLGIGPDEYLGPEPGRTAWSRHVSTPEAAELSDGTLCSALLDRGGKITALYPVMISRKLDEGSPLESLDSSLRPASSLDRLSPADRVFGWVNQDGRGAYRGHVRVGPVTCAREDAIERFDTPGLSLAILGQPQPQQGRFYVAAGRNGAAQPDDLPKDQAGYRAGKGLRGRKVYPHHRSLPAHYWQAPTEDRTQDPDHPRFQEYRRPTLTGQDQRDHQNRSILGWVKPKTEFTFDLHVTNLSAVELGGLLWLLALPAGHFHRLGGGKPLGFGSVRIEIVPEWTHLHTGASWKTFYSTLDGTASPEVDREAALQAFRDAVPAAYGQGRPFEQVPFIAAFLRAARGFDDPLPIHYPRARQADQAGAVPPHPEGKAYEWFVANDRAGRDSGPRACLRDLADDPGLPMLEASP